MKDNQSDLKTVKGRVRNPFQGSVRIGHNNFLELNAAYTHIGKLLFTQIGKVDFLNDLQMTCCRCFERWQGIQLAEDYYNLYVHIKKYFQFSVLKMLKTTTAPSNALTPILVTVRRVGSACKLEQPILQK